jgi:proteasome assembly chaperone (PAC2) family protein
MGQVGSIAAGYLVHKLGAKEAAELPARGFFDIEQVQVRQGVIVPARLPRSALFRWRDESAGVELLIFLGEAQPSSDGLEFANRLLDEAATLGVERIVTFASVASQLHPSQAPKAFGVVTQPDMKPDLDRIGAAALEDGLIGGLNGVLLGAAAERGLPGVCLLGEIPYFAGAVANPKAARAVLGAFSRLTGIAVDTTELAQHDAAVDRVMMDLLERLKQQAEQGGENAPPIPEEPAEAEEADAEAEAAEKPQPTLDFAARERIERLFDEARRDRSRSVALKQELDRLGAFPLYEDRFLDLFKRAA